MQREKIEMYIPWTDTPFTAEEQKEANEFHKYHMNHPEFYPGAKYYDDAGNVYDASGNIIYKAPNYEEE
ncbi:MAG: hypothetical protein RSF92_11160 [Niameybacter sp.]|uniref:hypothetical protein n=1 Tax=Niameybacter sp. TaxID=2033640 RepID=UPI002FC5F129